MISLLDPNMCWVLKAFNLILALSIDASVNPKSAITPIEDEFITWPGEDLLLLFKNTLK